MILNKKIKTHVHAGDTVKVISGNHRGSEGKILRVIPGKNQVLIEGVRMIKKHLGRSQERPQGEIIEKEGPIHISNVKLIEKSPSIDTTSSKNTKKVLKASKKEEISQVEESPTAEEAPKKRSSKKAASSKQEE